MAFRLVSRFNRGKTSPYQKRYCSTAPPLPSYLANLGPAKVSSSGNGLRVVSESSLGDSGAACVQLWVRAGSCYETPQNNGVATLLQRLAVKAKEEEITKFGGKLTGGVCREFTVFSVQCLPGNVPQAVQTLGDIAAGLAFSGDSFQKEKNSMLCSARSLSDTWNEDTLKDHLFAAAYQGTPFALAPSGDANSIKSLENSAVSAFHSAQYTARNMVLSIVGADAPANKTLESINAGNPVPLLTSRLPFTGSQVNIRDDTVHNAQVLLAYETVPYGNREWAALQVLQTLLGRWCKGEGLGNNSSTRLSEIIASEKLADHFNTFNCQSSLSGLFGVYFNTHNVDKLDDTVYEVFNEYQKLFQNLYVGEVVRSQNQLTTKYLLSLNDPACHAANMAKQVSYIGRRIPPSETVARIHGVTTDQVRDVIDIFFNDTDPVVVAHGPLEEMPDYGILRSWTFWNRR